MTPLLIDSPRRVLLLIAGDIGDVIRTTPYIRAARKRFPAAHLAALVSERGVAALANCPYLDEVVARPVLDDDLSLWRKTWGKASELAVSWSRVRRRFDVVISFVGPEAGGPFWHALAFASGARTRIGHGVHGTGPLLTHDLGDGNSGLLSRRLDRLFARLGVPLAQGERILEIWPTDRDRLAALKLLNENGIQPTDHLVVVGPGSDWSCQQWGADNWAAVIDALTAEFGTRTVVVGITRESRIAAQIRRVAEHPVVDLTGRTTVGQLAAVMERSQLALTLESAPAEVALAVGAPTVVLFGSIPNWLDGQHRAPAVAVKIDDSATSPNLYTACKLTKMLRGVHRCESDLCVGGEGLASISTRQVIAAARLLLKQAIAKDSVSPGAHAWLKAKAISHAGDP